MKKIIITLTALVMTTTATMAQRHTVITPDQIKWGMLNPARGDQSPKAFDLYGDRTKDTATGMLVKFEKGFTSPPHIHNITYRGVVIEGLMHNADPKASIQWLPKGSFWVQPAGGDHVTAAGDDGNFHYHYHIEGAERTHIMMTPSAYFSSDGKSRHYIETFDTEVMLYVRNIGGYHIKAE